MVKKLLTLLGFSAILLSGTLHAQWITGYFESNNGVESVSQIPWNKYTHIVHFAASTSGSGDVQLHWLNQTEIQQIIAARPAGKKVLVCIQDNGSNTSAMMNSTSPGTIGTFVTNIVNFVNSNGYDGVDIDWEVNINATQHAVLFQQLRAAMPGKLITTAMSNNSAMIAAAAAAYGSIDQINMMCYDMDSSGNGYSWYNDALVQNGNSSVMTCDWRVNPLLNAGVPASKIGVGLPFYGRRLSGVTKPLVNGNFSQSTVFYKDLVSDSSRWQAQYQVYDSGYKSNYLSISAKNRIRLLHRHAGGLRCGRLDQEQRLRRRYDLLALLRISLGTERRRAVSALDGALLGAGRFRTRLRARCSEFNFGRPAKRTLASSTTQVNMSVVTSVNASCKYATTAGFVFGHAEHVRQHRRDRQFHAADRPFRRQRLQLLRAVRGWLRQCRRFRLHRIVYRRGERGIGCAARQRRRGRLVSVVAIERAIRICGTVGAVTADSSSPHAFASAGDTTGSLQLTGLR